MTRPAWSEYLAVAVGGALGTGLRWGLDLLIPHRADQFPVSTLITNLAGTLVLAILVAAVWTRPVPAWLKAGLGPGVLGTYTTFSAIALALVTLTEAGEPAVAAIYLVASVVGGLAIGALGFAVGGRLRPIPWREELE